MKRLLVIAVFAGLSACATTNVSQERVNNIVASIRDVSAKGFFDITIDYVKPDLKVTGHAYSTAHISMLMRAMENGGASHLRLQDVHFENDAGRHRSAFTIVESGVGDIRDWQGPIVLKSSFPSSTQNHLAKYPLKDLAFVGVLFMRGDFIAIIKAPDKHLYRLRKGDRLGSENALIKDISYSSLDIADD